MDWAWGAQVVRFLRSITPQSSPTVKVRSLAGGTTFTAAPGAQPSSFSHPFKVENFSDDDGAAVRVVFGQVNSVTPTIGGTALDALPGLLVVSGVVYLQVNLDDDGFVDTAVIGNAATLPDDTDTEGYITLATVTVASGAVTAINQSVTHSLGHQRCGEAVHNFWGV